MTLYAHTHGAEDKPRWRRMPFDLGNYPATAMNAADQSVTVENFDSL
jgi:hypothetical protein